MGDGGNGGFTLLGDEPHVGDPDTLGFERTARQLADSVLASSDSSPFTVGIEGGWGTGKSSLMRRLERALPPDRVTTVWFNAWTAEGANALEGLIKTVLEKLDPNVLRRSLRNRRLVSWARAIGLVIAGWLRLGSVVETAWERVSVDARARNELRSLLHEAIEDWRKKHAGVAGSRLLVIFVDDLDRASPERVFEIFEAIKLYLDAPGFVFVIGYDQTIVTDAVLAEKKFSRTITGREYLEKIIQVGYRIAPPDDEQAAALMVDFAARSGTAALFDESARTLIVERNRRNPRRIKRFLNGFVLLYILDSQWRELGPDNLGSVLLLEMYFPEFTQLFADRATEDPVTEFLDYESSRTGKTDEELQEIERALPEFYPALARSREFVALVKAMKASPQFDAVKAKLERRGPVTSALAADSSIQSSNIPPVETPVPAPVSVLVVGPDVLDLAETGRVVASRGWHITTAPTVAEALGQAERFPPMFDAWVVAFEGDLPAAEWAALENIAPLDGRATIVLYCRRLTPELRSRAEGLGLQITSSPDTLVTIVEGSAGRRLAKSAPS